MSGATMALGKCPDCGADVAAEAPTCWLCFADLSATAAERIAASPAPPPIPTAGAHTFSLDTLFLVMTLVAVCAGIVAAAPEALVFVVLIVVPAVVRTLGKTRQRVKSGEELTASAKIGAFFGSLMLAALTWAAAMVAFFGACWAACGAAALVGAAGPYGGNALTFGFIIGGIVGLVVFVSLYRLLWPGRRRKKAKGSKVGGQGPGQGNVN